MQFLKIHETKSISKYKRKCNLQGPHLLKLIAAPTFNFNIGEKIGYGGCLLI